jgi:hypothetical protein
LRILSLLAVMALLAPAGCKLKHHANPSATVEEETELASFIHVADPRDSSQIISGFYGVEQNAWRWTMQSFVVSLAPPEGAAQRGAKLVLQFALPQVLASKMLGVTVTPVIDGSKLPPFKVVKAGDQSCSFDVPAELLKKDAVLVDFQLDRTAKASESDSRELGLVVSAIGFQVR